MIFNYNIIIYALLPKILIFYISISKHEYFKEITFFQIYIADILKITNSIMVIYADNITIHYVRNDLGEISSLL